MIENLEDALFVNRGHRLLLRYGNSANNLGRSPGKVTTLNMRSVSSAAAGSRRPAKLSQRGVL